MRKIGSILFIGAMIFSIIVMSGCIAPEEEAEFNFAIIFATGGLGDKSFNDAAYRGYEQAIAEYGSQINIDYVEPTDIPEFATFQIDFASQEKYDLIICIGFLQTSALNTTVKTYPNQQFVLIDDVLDTANVSSITFKEHEGSFLVGAMAAMTTNTSKLGFLGGMDFYLINKFLAGYEQGAHYIDDNINVTAQYSPNPDNPWGDIPGGKSVAETMLASGIDIIFAAAGGTGIGAFQAINETANTMGIGVDSDQDYLAKGKILCSMLKKVETAVYSSIADVIAGTWTGGQSVLGLAEDGVGISEMIYTQANRNKNFTIGTVTQTTWEWIQEIKADIIDGTITVSDTPAT